MLSCMLCRGGDPPPTFHVSVSVDVDDLLRQFFRLHVFVREALPILGDFADIDRLLRAVLHAAQAADAVSAENGLVLPQLDVAAGTYPGAGAAGDAVVVDPELFDELGMHFGKGLALHRKERILRRFPAALLHGLDRGGNLHGLSVDARLRVLLRCGREAEAVRHQPDTGGVVGDRVPVVEVHDFVDLMKAAAQVSGKLFHRKFVGIRGDFDQLQIFFFTYGYIQNFLLLEVNRRYMCVVETQRNKHAAVMLKEG